MRFQICMFTPKLGVKTSDITTLYGYEYISIITCFKSSESCTVLKGWKKLVHSLTLKCSHITIFFMLFIPSHTWSWQDGSLQLLCLFCGRWHRRVLRQSFYAPVYGLSTLVVILIFPDDIYVSYYCISSPLCWSS